MGEVLSQRRLSELIGAIYDCALDPGRWEPTLAEVADTFDCAVVSLTLNDLHKNRFLINKAAGWQPDLLQLKSERHVGEINARLTEWLTLQSSIDEMFVTSHHLGDDYVRTSAYAEECLKPQGIVDIMHMFLMHTHRQFAEIGLGRHESQGIITEREIELGRLLLPHLRKAVTISDILDVRSIERAHMAEALDALRCGVVLTDARGGILHANRSAERMMGQGSPIRSVRRVLAASASSASRDLRRAIHVAARHEARPGETSAAIRLTDTDQPPAYAHVLPMATGELRTRLQPNAVAAIFIGVPDEHNGIGLLARAFNLTAAEIRIMESLMAGHTLAETARHFGIARSTAKTHLDHIFAKTGVSRQTELVRLTMQLTQPVHGPPRDFGYSRSETGRMSGLS
ncbi:helix-turn-helix transcriptional regulator [Microvirga zambiensis]|uniref:helix-turn-helix transcriptional regulator n=1 Tax=Microvirga zambiensis TaxID=1402137 RepID=UPI00191D5807|nr:LuxR C-terminal-related transcriptional regulator [Microvirga zambiensis]